MLKYLHHARLVGPCDDIILLFIKFSLKGGAHAPPAPVPLACILTYAPFNESGYWPTVHIMHNTAMMH